MKKALFLDRDGVVNVDFGYTYKVHSWQWVWPTIRLMRLAQTNGYQIIIVTNQSGIARGYYSEQQVEQLHQFLKNAINKLGVTNFYTYHCPHHPQYSIGPCRCRKPAPGMLLNAVEAHNIDVAQSILIGDKRSDLLAAQNAHLKSAYLYANSNTDISDISIAQRVSCPMAVAEFENWLNV